jgi:tetratricopeptide (TPR) repeat protein
MRKILVIGLVLFWGGCTTPSQQNQRAEISEISLTRRASEGIRIDLPTLVKKVAPSIVVVRVFDKENKFVALGTGFLVSDDGKLVTNYHVIENGVSGEVKLSSGETLRIKGIISEDVDGDLVLLALDKKGKFLPYLGLSNKKVETGQRVFVVGNPFGLERTLSEGIISAVREISDFGKIFQITAPISEGSSGSPVLDMEGEVVGVATLYIKEGQSLNFAIPIDRVNTLISQSRANARRIAEIIEEEKKKRFLEALRNSKELVIEDTLSPEALKMVQEVYNEDMNVGYIGTQKDALISLLEGAAKIDPNYHAAYYLLGLSYGSKELFDKAIMNLKRSIEIKPEYSEAYVRIAEIYRDTGRLDDAILNFNKGIEKKPEDSLAHYGLGISYQKKGQYEDAKKELREAIALRKDYFSAKLSLGIILTSQKKYSAGMDVLREIRPGYMEEFYTYAELNDEEYEEAVSVFSKELQSSPDNPDLCQGLAYINFFKGRYDLSIHYFKKINPSNIGDFSSLLKLGISYFYENEYKEAKSNLSKAVGLNPHDFKAHMYLGLCHEYDYDRQGGEEEYHRALDRALSEINKAVEIAPYSSWALYHLGDIYASKENYESALAVLQKAVDIASWDKDIQSKIAYVYRMKKQYGEAIDHYKKALQIKEEAYTYAELGETYEEMSEFDKALENYQQANRLSKADYFDKLIAGVYLKQKNYRQAIEIYQNLIIRHPKITGYRFSLAVALSRYGKRSDAIKEYVQLIEINPKDWDSHYNLGLLYMEDGDRESLKKAIKHFSNYLAGVKGVKGEEEYLKWANVNIEDCNDRIEEIEYPDKIRELSTQSGIVGFIATMVLTEEDYSKGNDLFISGLNNTKPVFKELTYSKEKIVTEYEVSPDLFESQALFKKFEDRIKDLEKKDDKYKEITGPFIKAAQNRIEGIEIYSKGYYLLQKDYRGEFEKGVGMIRIADIYFLEGLKNLLALMKKHPSTFGAYHLKRMEISINYYENKYKK